MFSAWRLWCVSYEAIQHTVDDLVDDPNANDNSSDKGARGNNGNGGTDYDDRAHKHDGDDGGDHDSVYDPLPQLPIELWVLIFREAAPTAQRRFLIARVCKAWRRALVDEDQLAGRKPMTHAAEACRMRLAREAIDASNAELLKWSLVEARAVLPVPRASMRLWERVPTSGSAACARVLMELGIAPCDCQTCGKRDCRLAMSILEAAKCGHVDLLCVLVAHPLSASWWWPRYALCGAVDGDHVEIIQRMADGHDMDPLSVSREKLPRSAMTINGNSATWGEVAAVCGRTRALACLCKHGIDVDSLDAALVHAARTGHTETVVWICERGGIERFVEGFIMALAGGHHGTATAMLSFGSRARIYAETQGDTLDEAVERVSQGITLDPAARAILDRLLAL
nr:hypothetical protein [Pandoravirus aubagnensis]